MKYGLDGSAMNKKLKRMEKLSLPIEMKVIEGNMFEVSISKSVISNLNTVDPHIMGSLVMLSIR